MKLEWKSYMSLKTPILVAFVAFVVLWNLGFGYSLFVGGGIDGVFSPEAKRITRSVLWAAFLFFIIIALFKPIQNKVVAKTRHHNFNVTEFYFAAAITCFMAVGW